MILLIIAIIFCIFQMVVLATEIDVGGEAIWGAYNTTPGDTWIYMSNPANDSGIINQLQFYADGPLEGCKVGIFYAEDETHFTTRSWVTIGDVGDDEVVTFTKDSSNNDLAMDVETGDFIGVYFTAGALCRNIVGDYIWSAAGDVIGNSNVEFTSYSTFSQSLYGTGTTEEVAKKKNVIFMGSNF